MDKRCSALVVIDRIVVKRRPAHADIHSHPAGSAPMRMRIAMNIWFRVPSVSERSLRKKVSAALSPTFISVRIDPDDLAMILTATYRLSSCERGTVGAHSRTSGQRNSSPLRRCHASRPNAYHAPMSLATTFPVVVE